MGRIKVRVCAFMWKQSSFCSSVLDYLFWYMPSSRKAKPRVGSCLESCLLAKTITKKKVGSENGPLHSLDSCSQSVMVLRSQEKRCSIYIQVRCWWCPFISRRCLHRFKHLSIKHISTAHYSLEKGVVFFVTWGWSTWTYMCYSFHSEFLMVLPYPHFFQYEEFWSLILLGTVSMLI